MKGNGRTRHTTRKRPHIALGSPTVIPSRKAGLAFFTPISEVRNPPLMNVRDTIERLL